eukprot:COSAG05_NODE_98_length_19441_cov_32.923327_1_plen_49_part_10
MLEGFKVGLTNEKFDKGDVAYDSRGTYGSEDDANADHVLDAIPFGVEVL